MGKTAQKEIRQALEYQAELAERMVDESVEGVAAGMAATKFKDELPQRSLNFVDRSPIVRDYVQAVNENDFTEATLSAQEFAQSIGFEAVVYHGTLSQFDVFDPYINPISPGVHVGTFNQANARLKSVSESGSYNPGGGKKPTMLKLAARIRNPYRIDDAG